MYVLLDSTFWDVEDVDITLKQRLWRSPWYEEGMQFESGTVTHSL